MEKPLTDIFMQAFDSMPPELQDVVLMFPPMQTYKIKNTGEECVVLGYEYNTKESQTGVKLCLAVGLSDGETIAKLFPEELLMIEDEGH